MQTGQWNLYHAILESILELIDSPQTNLKLKQFTNKPDVS